MNDFRQCPNCKHKYNYFETVKKIYFRFLWKTWECDNCGTKLKISPKRRLLNAMIFTLFVAGLLLIRKIIAKTFLFIVLAIIAIIVVSLVLVWFEKFKESSKKK